MSIYIYMFCFRSVVKYWTNVQWEFISVADSEESVLIERSESCLHI
jgi:hypothetical protein